MVSCRVEELSTTDYDRKVVWNVGKNNGREIVSELGMTLGEGTFEYRTKDVYNNVNEAECGYRVEGQGQKTILYLEDAEAWEFAEKVLQRKS